MTPSSPAVIKRNKSQIDSTLTTTTCSIAAPKDFPTTDNSSNEIIALILKARQLPMKNGHFRNLKSHCSWLSWTSSCREILPLTMIPDQLSAYLGVIRIVSELNTEPTVCSLKAGEKKKKLVYFPSSYIALVWHWKKCKGNSWSSTISKHCV